MLHTHVRGMIDLPWPNQIVYIEWVWYPVAFLRKEKYLHQSISVRATRQCLSSSGYSLSTFSNNILMFHEDPITGHSSEYETSGGSSCSGSSSCNQVFQMARERCNFQPRCTITEQEAAVQLPGGCGVANYFEGKPDHVNGWLCSSWSC